MLVFSFVFLAYLRLVKMFIEIPFHHTFPRFFSSAIMFRNKTKKSYFATDINTTPHFLNETKKLAGLRRD